MRTKATFLTLFLILICFAAQGQDITKSLLGFELGEKYSPKEIQDYIENEYSSEVDVQRESNSISLRAYDIPFAGYRWDCVSIALNLDYYLVSVYFIQFVQLKEDSDPLFWNLRRKLTKKYGTPYSNSEDSVIYGRDKAVGIMLKFDEEEKAVLLGYHDMQLFKIMMQEVEDQL